MPRLQVRCEHRGIAHHLLGRAARDHFAVVQDADVLGERHHRAHHVLDQEDRGAVLAVEVAEHLDHLVALGGTQPSHHFIEQQQLRPRGERARHLEALAVRQRERRCGQVALRAEAQSFHDIAGELARILGGRGSQECADHDVVEHGESGERLHDLEGAADAGGADLVRAQAVDGFPLENNFAGVRGIDAGDHIEDGGLAGAVRADQAVDVALGDLERRRVHRTQAAERFADRAHFEKRAHSRSFRASVGQMPCGRNITTRSSTTP